MSLPGFYALGGAWLFLLLIPLVIFYFLKLRRPRQEVTSLVLWQQVINDQRVNSPFQKFKRNFLLLLQLLLLTSLILAAMQPFLSTGADRARYVPVLIDCSASMGARDNPGGPTRLEAVKQQVGQMIDDLLPDQRLALISFHSTARRVTDFTNNKRVLRDGLRDITVADVPSKLEEALRMTQAMARTVDIDDVLLLTDGNLPADSNFELPFQLTYQQVAPGGKNIGITSLNARRSGSKQWEIFIRLEGSQTEQTAATVEWSQDGKLIGREEVILEQGQSDRLEFSVETESSAMIHVRLKPEGFDALDSDNVAFLDLPAGRDLKVYCPLEMKAFRHALRGMKDLVVEPVEGSGASEFSEYDLLISDRTEEESPPADVSLFVGAIPADLQHLVSVARGAAEIVDWERTAPLLQYVELTEMFSSDEPRSEPDVQDRHYEEAGYEILAHGQKGPLIVSKRRGEKPAYYLLFHTNNSTLPYRVGFPILIANAVQIATRQSSLSDVRGTTTGVLPPRQLLTERTYQVDGPGGISREVASDDDGIVSGISAPLVGEYVLNEGGEEQLRIGASLLSSSETSLSGADKIQFSELSVTASETKVKTDRPLWPMLTVSALAFLLAEWWFFLRRPGGVVT